MIESITWWFALFVLLFIVYICGRQNGKRIGEERLPLKGTLRKAYIRCHPEVPPKNICFSDCLIEGIEITEEIRKTNGFVNCITGTSRRGK